MPYLIDGHNLIGALPDVSLSDPDDEAALNEILMRYFYRIRKNGIVYFDQRSAGSERLVSGPNLSVVFVRKPRTADQAIQAHLRRLGKEARNWTVVSSDRAVQSQARKAGARVVSSQDFSRLLNVSSSDEMGGEKPSDSLSEAELQGWIDLFKRRKNGC